MKDHLKNLLIVLLVAGVVLPAGISCSRTPEKEGGAEEHAEGAEGAAGEEHGDEHAEGEEGEAHEEGVVTLTPEAQARAGIRIAPVATRTLDPEIETTGQVGFNEDRMAHVGPRIAGRITSVRATLGQRVGSGEVLAVIDSVELGQARAAYQQARAREDLTRETYERERRLAADKISSEQEVLSARAAHLEAAAELRRAEETLRVFGLSTAQVRSLRDGQSGAATLSPVTSPFGGTVVEKEASLGEMVAPEAKLFTVADLSRVWIWIDLFEKDLGRVHLGDGVLAEVEAYPGETFAGKVTFLGGSVNAETRAVRARLEIDNGDGRLRPGMFARIRLSDPHGKPAEGGASVPVVPESAIQRQGEEFIAFVLEGERQYRRREVRTGKRSGGFIEVLEGLKPGENVVVEGTFLLASEMSKETLGGDDDH